MRRSLLAVLLLAPLAATAQQVPVGASGVQILDSAGEFVKRCSELQENMPRVESEAVKSESDKLAKAAIQASYTTCLAVIKTATYAIAEAETYRLKDGPQLCRKKDATPVEVVARAKELYGLNRAEFDKMPLSGPGIVLVALATLSKCD